MQGINTSSHPAMPRRPQIIMQENDSTVPRLSDIFRCTRCGYCCQGETTVSLDQEDQQRMVDKLGLPREEVREKYWRVTGNVVQMKTVDGHCIFYDEEAGCTVHEGRPWRCGQWPLHPSMLSDRNNYETIKASCPGITRDLEYEEFCRILQALLERQGVLIC
ncbi:hypothetical protein GF1_14060 [Desulfolithobacter dissulfuricans]|uniref:Fe-S oxidoreductase n=2 Tax=Desulfolithobacter dissulfuricans TaxID=2795293 RepID=A0A915U1B3_9BACT|nr:hypothetical protein GF1_14060 [Desulfolithobacter dissulfuricans]